MTCQHDDMVGAMSTDHSQATLPGQDLITAADTNDRYPVFVTEASSATAPPPSFKLIQQWHSQPRKLHIIHVGAGATDLCAAFKMERQLTDYELVCYEKKDEIWGTWLQNRYPGYACDVPAHIYTYTLKPYPKWESYYAYTPDIQDYFVDFC